MVDHDKQEIFEKLNKHSFQLLTNEQFWNFCHSAWRNHLINNDTHNLNNHISVPVKLRCNTSTFDSTCFQGWYSVLSSLEIPFRLKIWNCSHRHPVSQLLMLVP